MTYALSTVLILMLTVSYLLFFSVSAQPMRLKPTNRPVCSYDREVLLELDQDAFDQDLNGGWRAVARHESCLGVAANLIRDYRETRGLESGILYWHEGQLRAMTGATEEAIQLFERARGMENDPYGWNLYVDATIAFLQNDKAGLLNARKTLAQLPRLPDFQPRDQDQAGKLINISWPPNLNVVDRLIACFGRDYKSAYGRCEK